MEKVYKKFIVVDVGLEPTTPKNHGLSTTPFVKALAGLARLVICTRLTNSLPKLCLITLSPLKRRDSRSAGYAGGPVNISKPFHFLGIPGKAFFKFDMPIYMGKSGKSLLWWIWDLNPRPKKNRNHGLSTTPFVNVLVRY